MDSDQGRAEKSGSEMLSFGLLKCKGENQESAFALISVFKCKHAVLYVLFYIVLCCMNLV